LKLNQKPKIAHGKVIYIRRDNIQIHIRNSKPVRQRRRILICGRRRDQAPPTNIICTIQRQAGKRSVDIATERRITDDQLIAAPGMVCSVAI